MDKIDFEQLLREIQKIKSTVDAIFWILIILMLVLAITNLFIIK